MLKIRDDDGGDAMKGNGCRKGRSEEDQRFNKDQQRQGKKINVVVQDGNVVVTLR